MSARNPELRNELLPTQFVELCHRARQASRAGEWVKEIELWEEVLQHRPKNAEAQERKTIAGQCEKHRWMYENAAQLLREGKLVATKHLLKDLWYRAPDYGDPENLAQQVGLMRFLAARQRAAFMSRA